MILGVFRLQVAIVTGSVTIERPETVIESEILGFTLVIEYLCRRTILILLDMVEFLPF